MGHGSFVDSDARRIDAAGAIAHKADGATSVGNEMSVNKQDPTYDLTAIKGDSNDG